MNTQPLWITNNTPHPFYARKNISILKEIQSATARVCGLGQFVFYINGAKVGDHELDPGWTDYHKYVEYVTFDITSCLKHGQNTLAAEVGNGWYIMELKDGHYSFHFPPFMPPNPNPYKPFGNSLVLWAEIKVLYQDGSTELISTDTSWKVHEHMITLSNVYGSETADGRLAQNDWNCRNFDDTSWSDASIALPDDIPKGKLINQFQPAIKVIKTYDGKYLHTVHDRAVYDFSQNMSAMIECRVRGKRGDVIQFYSAEKLDADGDVDQMAKGWVLIDTCCTYIIGQDDTWETFRMKFTYFAGRYIAVSGAVDAAHTPKAHTGAVIDYIKADCITSAWENTGTFDCDDSRFNEIYHLVQASIEANMVSVHTDCPTIERFAWQEPNHLMAPSIMYMKNGYVLWQKFLKDMRAAQHVKDDTFLDMQGHPFYVGEGLMPSQAPCYLPNALPVPGMGSFYDIIPWGSTCILGTYWHYMFYGDEKIIVDNYDAGMRYLDYLKTKINADGFINHGLGDWGNPTGEFCRENIETAFLYANATILAMFADKLGKAEDKANLLAFAKDIKDNYNKKLLVKHPTQNFWCYKSFEHTDDVVMTQACEAMPLYWGLVPDEYRSDVEKAFRYVMETDQTLKSGEVGQPYIIQTMRMLDMNDMLCRFILKPEHPSYYAFVLAGETSLGEYWEDNPRSHMHDMMGHIIEWYYNGIAGIQIIEPGASHVLIKPYLPESMKWFKCTFKSVHGLISVEVRETDQTVDVTIMCPNGVVYSFDHSLLAKHHKKIRLIESNPFFA